MLIKNKKKKGLALSQIAILVLGIVAITYAISEVGLVSGQGESHIFSATDPIGSEFGGVPAINAPSLIPPSTASTPVDASVYGHMLEGMGLKGAETATTSGTTALTTAEKSLFGGYGEAAATGAETAAEGAGYFETLWSNIKSLNLKEIGLNAAIAYGLYKGVRLLAEMFLPDWYGTEALSTWGEYAGTGWGIGSGAILVVNVLFSQSFSLFTGGIIGLAVGTVIFLWTYKEEEQEVIIFNCLPWQPEPKGEHCDECGKGGLPCSKYQCQSLGVSCELLNEGTDEEICEWVNPLDSDPPTIEPWKKALKPGYKYNPDNTISPPDRGVIVEYSASGDKCAPAFSIVSFGIELDKASRCKASVEREDSYEEMPDLLLTNGLYLYNHSISVSVPSVEALEEEGITVENLEEQQIFVRCQSKNGESNPANFVFKYCISPEPDTSAPKIVFTTPLNGAPIQSGLTSINMEMYVDEPSECRWSHSDQDYDSMGGLFSCASSVREINAQMLYKCTTILDGLVSNGDNNFYFRCKDKPNSAEEDRNTNQESYKYTLVGTRPLVIDEVSPETGKLVKGSSDTVKVTLQAKTSAGYDDGKASCYYNEKCYREGGSETNYVLFNYESTELFSDYEHSQDLWLASGTYECSIRCVDLGGNSDVETTTYTVESDKQSPIITRAYNEALDLKLVTDEEAECVYDITDCSYNFEDGIKMKSSDDLNHYTDWNTKTNLYVKCKDKYENQPPPNYCSIIVRAIDI